jgi:hypothetical protein
MTLCACSRAVGASKRSKKSEHGTKKDWLGRAPLPGAGVGAQFCMRGFCFRLRSIEDYIPSRIVYSVILPSFYFKALKSLFHCQFSFQVYYYSFTVALYSVLSVFLSLSLSLFLSSSLFCLIFFFAIWLFFFHTQKFCTMLVHAHVHQ